MVGRLRCRERGPKKGKDRCRGTWDIKNEEDECKECGG